VTSLQGWQRYRKATPCPICHGYGAYKPENRCKGFLRHDGDGAYCTQVKALFSMDSEVGVLFWHPFKEQGEGEQVGRQRHPLLRMRSAGLQRKAARLKEAQRPPTAKDFG
jgi:hypothetical protein